MRPRFPLAAKILAWFFLNLLLLLVIAFVLGQQKLRFGLDSLVAGPRGDRLRALAVLVLQDFNQSLRPQWNAVLEKFGNENGVRLFLFSDRGAEIAGKAIALPAEVRARLHEGGPPQRHPLPGGSGPPPPPREEMEGPPHLPEVIGLQRAGDPARYWVVLHAPLPQLGEDGPALLVVVSDSLSAGGLIFDYAPLLWAVAVVIGVSVLFWLPLVRGITRSLAAMRVATARIAEGNFEIALAVDRSDELGALAGSINQMSERLAGLLNGQRRFLGDVAHELCAPLSRLQMALGILEARTAEADQIDDIRDEVDQISGLVNELLSFSRASLGAKKLQLREVSLRPVLEEAIRREAADVAQIELECGVDLGVIADRDLLLRAVSNLLRNSIRYARDGGPTTLRGSERAGEIAIEILDHGPGIPRDALEQIFDPFFRIDASRNRETGGVGLGLTIAKTCVEACGGTIRLQNREPSGLCALIKLDASVEAVQSEPCASRKFSSAAGT